METYVVRLWVPDRPGALGSVASRIGAVRGDVVGIDILERGDGLAVDEIVVELPGQHVVELLVREISEVDGVKVEQVRLAGEGGHDPRVDALETAAILLGASGRFELLEALCVHGGRTVGATWMAVVDLATGAVVAADGPHPEQGWLEAFVAGSRSAARSDEPVRASVGLGDVAWAPLPGAGLAVVFGCTDTVIRAREQRQLSALARIADARLGTLDELRARAAHPSRPACH